MSQRKIYSQLIKSVYKAGDWETRDWRYRLRYAWYTNSPMVLCFVACFGSAPFIATYIHFRDYNDFYTCTSKIQLYIVRSDDPQAIEFDPTKYPLPPQPT